MLALIGPACPRGRYFGVRNAGNYDCFCVLALCAARMYIEDFVCLQDCPDRSYVHGCNVYVDSAYHKARRAAVPIPPYWTLDLTESDPIARMSGRWRIFFDGSTYNPTSCIPCVFNPSILDSSLLLSNEL